MSVEIFVLNYNGRALLRQCLPSVIAAAEAAQRECRVSVIDNDSSDDSLKLLATQFPQVRVYREANRCLSSYNRVLANSNCRYAILLNNDIKLEPDAVDPLIGPLESRSRDAASDRPGGDASRSGRCFMTTSACWTFDRRRYEGFKTSIRWRWGLIQATSLFPGHQRTIHQPDLTANAGAVIAVERTRFLELGGFDDVYLPGRLEDLDFAFRGYLAGDHACYVPQAVAYHLGAATFHRELGEAATDQLALRNTLLFQWLNLRHPTSIARQLMGLPIRLAAELLLAAWARPTKRLALWKACIAAIAQLRKSKSNSVRRQPNAAREAWYLGRFAPSRLASPGACRADVAAIDQGRQLAAPSIPAATPQIGIWSSGQDAHANHAKRPQSPGAMVGNGN